MTLSAYQAIGAFRRAFPGAEMKGDRIRVGIWRMQLIGSQLPSACRPEDPHLDTSDGQWNFRNSFAACRGGEAGDHISGL